MPHTEVKKSIAELKGELGKIPAETSIFEEKLEAAKEGLEHFTPEAVKDLVQTLQREADEFEVDHPTVTALINHVMTSLSNLGI
ncbi:MAG: DUF4404 family protein [Pontiella sp.]